MKTMEIFIEEIPAQGLQINAKAPGEAWLEKVLADSLEERFTQPQAELKADCYKFDKDVDVKCVLDYTTHTECDRCLKPIVQQQYLTFKTHLSPLFKTRRQASKGADEEIVKDDEEFSYYEGSSFELGSLVSEQLVLNQPMQVLCSENCKGLCQRCGKNLNEVSCDCVTSSPDPRWDALKSLKLNDKN